MQESADGEPTTSYELLPSLSVAGCVEEHVPEGLGYDNDTEFKLASVTPLGHAQLRHLLPAFWCEDVANPASSFRGYGFRAQARNLRHVCSLDVSSRARSPWLRPARGRHQGPTRSCRL